MPAGNVARLLRGLIALSFLAPTAAHGQTVFQDCTLAELRRSPPVLDPTAAQNFPDSAYVRLLPQMARGEYARIADSIRRAVEADPADVPPVVRSGFSSQLAIAARELAEGERLPTTAVNRARFDIDPDPVDPNLVTLFGGQPHEVTVDKAFSPGARRAICWRALVLQRVLVTQGDSARRGALTRLQEAEKHWDNYGSKGQSQFPWELALNSLAFDPKQLDPPRQQWIVLHPSLGLELAGPRTSELRRLEVLVVEPLGFVRYNSSYSTYIGASVVLSFPDDADPGIGALAHFGRLAKLGYVFRGRDAEGVLRNGILLNVDLYRLLSGAPDAIRSAGGRATEEEKQRLAEQ